MIVPDPHMVIEPKKSKCEKDHINGPEWGILLYGIPLPGKAPYILPRNIPQSDQNRGISSRL